MKDFLLPPIYIADNNNGMLLNRTLKSFFNYNKEIDLDNVFLDKGFNNKSIYPRKFYDVESYEKMPDNSSFMFKEPIYDIGGFNIVAHRIFFYRGKEARFKGNRLDDLYEATTALCNSLIGRVKDRLIPIINYASATLLSVSNVAGITKEQQSKTK
jgi:hypothetical protein